jgi:Transglutaminase-like superfamily
MRYSRVNLAVAAAEKIDQDLHREVFQFNLRMAEIAEAVVIRRSTPMWRSGGVCRDFAHLAVTLCRCMNIPACYCTVDIGVPLLSRPAASHGRAIGVNDGQAVSVDRRNQWDSKALKR